MVLTEHANEDKSDQLRELTISLAQIFFFLPEDFLHTLRNHTTIFRFLFYFYLITITNPEILPFSFLIRIDSDLFTHSSTWTHMAGLGICLHLLIGLKHQTYGIGTDFLCKWHIATRRGNASERESFEKNIQLNAILEAYGLWLCSGTKLNK